MLCQGWLVEPCPLGMVYWKTLNLYRKFQFNGNFRVTQYFDNSHTAFSMAGISFQISWYGWKTIFSYPKDWKKVTFSETLAGISTLTQWTPWVRLALR